MAIVRLLILLVVAVSVISVDPALAAKKKKKKLDPGDIAYSRSGDTVQFPPVIFPHWRHIAQFRCYVCHSDLFEMQQSEGLGERMHEGDMCGSCHDGKPAFALGIQTCHRCHVTSEEGGDKTKKKKKKKKKKTKKEGAE